jgi:hypothetical protein
LEKDLTYLELGLWLGRLGARVECKSPLKNPSLHIRTHVRLHLGTNNESPIR